LTIDDIKKNEAIKIKNLHIKNTENLKNLELKINSLSNALSMDCDYLKLRLDRAKEDLVLKDFNKWGNAYSFVKIFSPQLCSVDVLIEMEKVYLKESTLFKNKKDFDKWFLDILDYKHDGALRLKFIEGDHYLVHTVHIPELVKGIFGVLYHFQIRLLRLFRRD